MSGRTRTTGNHVHLPGTERLTRPLRLAAWTGAVAWALMCLTLCLSVYLLAWPVADSVLRDQTFFETMRRPVDPGANALVVADVVIAACVWGFGLAARQARRAACRTRVPLHDAAATATLVHEVEKWAGVNDLELDDEVDWRVTTEQGLRAHSTSRPHLLVFARPDIAESTAWTLSAERASTRRWLRRTDQWRWPAPGATDAQP